MKHMAISTMTCKIKLSPYLEILQETYILEVFTEQ